VRGTTVILWLLLSSSLFGQVVLSRRVYTVRGQSYQQIWTWDPSSGAMRALTNSPRDHYLPVCKGGGRITFVSPGKYDTNTKLWSFNRATGEERVIGPGPAIPASNPGVKGCDTFAKAGALEACGKEQELFISRNGKRVGQFHIELNDCPAPSGGKHEPCGTPIQFLEWSPDLKWLVVGEVSSLGQSDYSFVDTASFKLHKGPSAADVLWLPGRDELLYATPQDLAPLPGTRRPRTVWAQQLMLFHPQSGKATALTSGTTFVTDLSLCDR
jgi:WD40 repeat protein